MSRLTDDEMKRALWSFGKNMAGLEKIAASMTSPLKSNMDYSGIARRLFAVEDLHIGNSIWARKPINMMDLLD